MDILYKPHQGRNGEKGHEFGDNWTQSNRYICVYIYIHMFMFRHPYYKTYSVALCTLQLHCATFSAELRQFANRWSHLLSPGPCPCTGPCDPQGCNETCAKSQASIGIGIGIWDADLAVIPYIYIYIYIYTYIHTYIYIYIYM